MKLAGTGEQSASCGLNSDALKDIESLAAIAPCVRRPHKRPIGYRRVRSFAFTDQIRAVVAIWAFRVKHKINARVTIHTHREFSNFKSPTGHLFAEQRFAVAQDRVLERESMRVKCFLE